LEKYTAELDKNDIYNDKCPILYALKIIGQKWKLPILWYLMDHDGIHYNELRRKVIGITNTMLTRCLRELEEDGLILRCDFKTIPPSVEYKLTQNGKELLPTLTELYNWGKKQITNLQ